MKSLDSLPEHKIDQFIIKIGAEHLSGMRLIKNKRDIDLIEAELFIEDNLSAIIKLGLYRHGYESDRIKELILKLLVYFSDFLNRKEKTISSVGA